MRSTSIRIDERAAAVLRELAQKQHKSMQAILNQAIESYRRQRFLEEANAAFAALRQNPEAWHEEQQERACWDRAVSDGLERE